MRLLRRGDTSDLSLTQFPEGAIPPYAILSHTWGADSEEVTFDDLTNGTGKDKSGYKKIRFCGEQAVQDGLEYFWIDTCCINKANHAELSQAINFMFRWYRNANRCYVYLSDVTSHCIDDDLQLQWDSEMGRSRWFTRGWTLQELLAPSSIEFFSGWCIRIGDRSSLKQQIQQITGIPASALEGARLSQFSVDERFLWMERRQTKLAEDKVYSLLGILDVEIPLYYGEGAGNAFKRVREMVDKRERCIQHLRLTDPSDDKKRIEETKGGLLEDSYRWILENSDFRRWRDNQQSRLLWIKGDPGKGKTMLLCGIINELSKSMTKTDQLSYFFCQATDSRINNATAVLRGLLYLLVSQQPSLVSHIQKKYDHAGKALFEDANAWVALSEIFTNILQDPSLNSTYLIINALNECVTDLPKLLDFIVMMSSISSRSKWILSSRNEAHIEQRLRLDNSGIRLSLELKENAGQVRAPSGDQKFSTPFEPGNNSTDRMLVASEHPYENKTIRTPFMDKSSTFSYFTGSLKGHESDVYSVAFASNGRVLASGSWDGTVRLWDASSGQQLRSLEGHGSSVWSVGFSPDDRMLASGSADRSVRLWDASSGRELHLFKDHGNVVRSVAFAPDRRVLASASQDGTIKLWNTGLGRLIATIEGHGRAFYSVAFSPDGRVLASGLESGIVKLWDSRSRRELHSLEGHGNYVYDVAFSPGGRLLASGSWDGSFMLWDADSGRQLDSLKGHESSVRSVAFAPDGRLLASGSWDGSVRLWDVGSGRQLRSLDGHGKYFYSVAFSPDGRALASGSADGTVRLWDNFRPSRV